MSKRTLRRKTLEQVQAAWESGVLSKPTSESAPQKNRFFLVKNNSLITFKTGSPVKITGFSSSPTYAAAKQKMLANHLVMTIAAPAAADAAESSATAVETILPGKIGRIQAEGLTFGIVTINDSTHEYADATFSSVASDGVYKILAKSALASGSAVCALVKLSGGGSSEGDKIMRGTIASLITSTSTPRYNITGSDGNTYDVALTIYPSTLLVIGKQAVFCVPADGSQAWLINTESV